jgi:uncharacterized protein
MKRDPQYDFDWDPVKADQNLQKHGVSFEEAATVFLDPLAMTLADEDHSRDEERWITQGLQEDGKQLVVMHTFREIGKNRALIRIFSARRATPRERRRYEVSQ